MASLIDLGTQVAARLHEFASQTSEIPDSFRALSIRLPLLNTTLQAISSQTQAGRLPQDVVVALQAVVASTFKQVGYLQTCLSQIFTPSDESRVRRGIHALKSLAKDKEVQAAVQRVHQDIDFLVLHQTTRHVGMGERILEELAQLRLLPATSSTSQTGKVYSHVSAHDQSNVHTGDVYHLYPPEPEKVVPLGWCLGSAPLIDRDNFIGRLTEIGEMHEILHPSTASAEQRRLVLGGMGGIGKTQLASAYARQHQHEYSSVLWLNATSEMTLKASLRSMTPNIVRANEIDHLDDEQALARIQAWLCNNSNTEWLLIFDSYDEPDQFSIDDYIPNSGHGSVMITTRLPDAVRGWQVRVKPLVDLEDSLKILQTRSQRSNIENDAGARHLATRLAGLPLALATAGAYLQKTTLTFEQYLDAYEQRFNVNPRRPTQLQEYQDRTLYTTWDMTYSRLERDDRLAAQMLKLLAYFDNQEIWYGLLHGGLDENTPEWLQEVAGEHIDFENVMSALVEYCMVEAHQRHGSYSMHSCVHDWTLAQLNSRISEQLYWYAVKCTVSSIGELRQEMLERLHYARPARHGLRCAHPRFLLVLETKGLSLYQMELTERIASLLAKQVQLSAAKELYLRVVAGYEKALGADHTSTLNTIHDLGMLYRDQGKLEEAEQMCLQALAGYEKALGADHTWTVNTIHNLGSLYADQGKLQEAEQTYLRALAGYEKALGADHTSTLNTIHNLGSLYADQGKLEAAEHMSLRALAGKENALGADHTSTLHTVNNLGNLYADQGKLEEAEQMYLRALAGKEKVLGVDHISTLNTVNNLASLCRDQGKLQEAEQMYLRAIAGKEKALGVDHTSTLQSVNNLGILCAKQGKLGEAEQMYLRALAGKEKALGADHTSTLNTVNNLGNLYRDQDKLEEAEQMYLRALAGYEKALGVDHTSTLETAHNLGSLYRDQGKLGEAEQMYLRALMGMKSALGPDHPRTLSVSRSLSECHRWHNRVVGSRRADSAARQEPSLDL